MLQVGIVAVLF